MVSMLLGAKAEMVIGVLLVMRNRTFRLACVLSLTMVILALMQDLLGIPRANQSATVFLIAGSLAAIAGSRLLAPGGALAASRQVAAQWWLVPLGRLTGGLLVVLPIAATTVFSLGTGEAGPFRMSITTTVFSAAIASAALALAPTTSASAAVVFGFVAVWMSVVRPAGVNLMFEDWPSLQRALVLMWRLLPLQWRATHSLDSFIWVDALVLTGWIVLGVVFAGWVTTPVRFGPRWLRGGAWRRLR
jgi:hypothetical protein